MLTLISLTEKTMTFTIARTINVCIRTNYNESWWKFALTSKSYLLSETSKTLLRLNAVPTNAAFCKQLIIVNISIFLNFFSRKPLIVPSATITKGKTVALMSHNLCTFNLKPSYFVTFSNSFELCCDLLILPW